VVEFAFLVLGCGPAFPSVRLVEDVSVFIAVQRGLGGLVLLQIVEIFQEQQPGCLLGVVELSSAASFFPKNIVDVFEGLFEHIFILKCFQNICRRGRRMSLWDSAHSVNDMTVALTAERKADTYRVQCIAESSSSPKKSRYRKYVEFCTRVGVKPTPEQEVHFLGGTCLFLKR
jgi:hypothetical protein